MKQGTKDTMLFRTRPDQINETAFTSILKTMLAEESNTIDYAIMTINLCQNMY